MYLYAEVKEYSMPADELAKNNGSRVRNVRGNGSTLWTRVSSNAAIMITNNKSYLYFPILRLKTRNATNPANRIAARIAFVPPVQLDQILQIHRGNPVI